MSSSKLSTPRRELLFGREDIPELSHNEFRVSFSKRWRDDSYSSHSNTQQSKPELVSPKGQVRFSIPDITENSNDMEADLPPVVSSPTRIVFPNEDTTFTSNRSVGTPPRGGRTPLSRPRSDVMGYVVDMHSKVMIKIPELQWSPHDHREGNNGTERHSGADKIRENSTNFVPRHRMTKSLQSVLSQTVDEYSVPCTNDGDLLHQRNKSADELSLDAMSPSHVGDHTGLHSARSLSPRRNSNSRGNLYLSSDSPINKYKVPIPLEINLPPYLSKANANKNTKRNSLIFDGKGYSQYNGDALSEEESDSEVALENEENTTSEGLSTLIKDDSIPSATYDISYDVDAEEADWLLGIDKEANVNLKLQNKNLTKKNKLPALPLPSSQRSKDYPSKTDASGKHGTSAPPTRSFHGDNILSNDCVSPTTSRYCREETNESLNILATPSRSIIIPDLDEQLGQTPRSEAKSPNGTLKFFEKFNSLGTSSYDENVSPTAKQNFPLTDVLNTSFKFPNMRVEKQQQNKNNQIEIDDNFQKVAPVSEQFEKRRKSLQAAQHEGLLSPNRQGFGNTHRRSQSVYTINFWDTTGKNNTSEDVLVDATSTPPRFSRNSRGTIGLSPHHPKLPYELGLNSGVHLDGRGQSDPSHVTKKPPMMPLSEIRESEEIRPLSSFNSFSRPVVPYVDFPITKDIKSKKNQINLLSPTRQLSNSESTQSSSTNSQFSQKSARTDITGYSYLGHQAEDFGSTPVKAFPQFSGASDEDDFKIVKERRDDGKIVEVIVLEDDFEEKVDGARAKSLSDTTPKRMLRGSKNSKLRETSPARFGNVLSICEQTAVEARNTIYELAGK
ncbi:Fir1p KNAG_0E01460 [Huiozyma naganishii CBS 8797]|uniref:Uncharacterized protein n=1 Tax=Huiozyma naganishii (strain ATCC MYA-139 / BCRC 22969 / CBS 8797 / KCTC 17520 / NBRC 10181 / NCYC 3082 / Yp74L-3) TaxID=1071383 RepID=J7R6C9_HUIN7|nr:hypothetical protein KNAG_0E01460 [Kazachstania naganishii CBS 8797]CCK70410.1 hypothetical protein KNAG_0E01460 [Kazachstania naganishii CBS 8797]